MTGHFTTHTIQKNHTASWIQTGVYVHAYILHTCKIQNAYDNEIGNTFNMSMQYATYLLTLLVRPGQRT